MTPGTDATSLAPARTARSPFRLRLLLPPGPLLPPGLLLPLGLPLPLCLLLLAGCVAPQQQPYYVTRPFTYTPPPPLPATPYEPAPLVFQPPTPLSRPDPPPPPDAAPEPAEPPVTASIPQPAPVPPPASPIQRTSEPDANTNVPMMGFRPMRGQKPPGA